MSDWTCIDCDDVNRDEWLMCYACGTYRPGFETLTDDEGSGYTRDAFEAAYNGGVIYCLASDLGPDDPPCLAVMISPKRYEELLEFEWMYKELQ